MRKQTCLHSTEKILCFEFRNLKIIKFLKLKRKKISQYKKYLNI